MKSRSISIVLILAMFTVLVIPVLASARANPNIDSAGISLSSAMKARFECSASNDYNISVYSVTLQVKNSNGTWSTVGSLSSPPSASNTAFYTKSVSYASSCTKGKTYRISATFDASGETVTRTSNEMTYK